jgi:hypothetical protein
LERAIHLENVGRESHTYLHHILENYDALAALTIFCQDNPFPHSPDFLERVNSLVCDTADREFTNLCQSVATDDGQGQPCHPGLPLSLYYRKIFGVERNSFTFGAGAQFAVRREAIRRRPPEFYRCCMDVALTPPHGPWVIERYWPYIFTDEGVR